MTARRSAGDVNGPNPTTMTGNDGKELALLRSQYEELMIVKRVLDARVFELQQQMHQQVDNHSQQAARVERAERDKQRAESELQRLELDLQVSPLPLLQFLTHPHLFVAPPLSLSPPLSY